MIAMSGIVVWWTEHDEVKSAHLADAGEALALYDELVVRVISRPSMVEFASGSPGCALAIGAGATETVVTFQSSLDPPYFISAGEASKTGDVWFEYSGEATAYSASNVIPAADGRHALVEYLHDSRRPSAIDWERL